VVAAAVAAAALSCHPEPGLGTLTYVRRGRQHVLDLSNCRDSILEPGASKPQPLVSPDGRFVATVVAKRHGDRGTNAIVVRNRDTGTTRTVYLVHESYGKIPAGSPGPILLNRWSGDGRWLFFTIDPQGSNSIAADGLMLQVVSARGGRPHRVAMTSRIRTTSPGVTAGSSSPEAATGSPRPTSDYSSPPPRTGEHGF
jgi:hypothetical protein